MFQDSINKGSTILASPEIAGKKREGAGVQFLSRNSEQNHKSNSTGLYLHGDSGTPSYH